jgi:hypothetical protein
MSLITILLPRWMLIFPEAAAEIIPGGAQKKGNVFVWCQASQKWPCDDCLHIGGSKTQKCVAGQSVPSLGHVKHKPGCVCMGSRGGTGRGQGTKRKATDSAPAHADPEALLYQERVASMKAILSNMVPQDRERALAELKQASLLMSADASSSSSSPLGGIVSEPPAASDVEIKQPYYGGGRTRYGAEEIAARIGLDTFPVAPGGEAAWLRDAFPHVQYFEQWGGKETKSQLSTAGRGKEMLSNIFRAHGFPDKHDELLGKMYHVFVCLRSFSTEAKTHLGQDRLMAIEDHLVFEDSDCNAILRMFNPYLPKRSENFRSPFAKVIRKVKTHDIFKRGPRLWQTGDESSPGDTCITEIGPSSMLHFDDFMQDLYSKAWEPESVSDGAAVRTVLIVTVSRALSGTETWTEVSNVNGLRDVIQRYIDKGLDGIRFSGSGDYTASTSSFGSAILVIIESWTWVEELVQSGASSWTALSEAMTSANMKYCKQKVSSTAPYKFVQSHCLENLLLLNSAKRRLNVEWDPEKDASLLVGLGPNSNGFALSYLADQTGDVNHTQWFRQFHGMVVQQQHKASAKLPGGDVLNYRSPPCGMTFFNTQDVCCIFKKIEDFFALTYISEKNRWKPKGLPAASTGG